MIRRAGEDGGGAVELLGEHHAGRYTGANGWVWRVTFVEIGLKSVKTCEMTKLYNIFEADSPFCTKL